MLAKPTRNRGYETFRAALLGALTNGERPSQQCELGPATRAIIEEIAARHPEANPLLVADAYDAFDRDHDEGQWRTSATTPHC